MFGEIAHGVFKGILIIEIESGKKRELLVLNATLVRSKARTLLIERLDRHRTVLMK
jgi:hypothetical protein